MKYDRTAANIETATRAGELVEVARQLLVADGDLVTAAHNAANDRYAGVAAVLKGAVAAGSLSNYSAIAEYPGLAAAFLDSLRNVGAFDRMLVDMVRVPLRTRVAISSVAITGNSVGEASAKPISSLTLDAAQLAEQKALALLVISKELLRLAGPAGRALFSRELRKAVAAATDNTFIQLITDGLSPITSIGSTVAAIRADLGAALDAIDVHDGSKLYILLNSIVAKRWAVKQNEGDTFLEHMTPNGGAIAGMNVVVTDAVDDGTVVVCDAGQIAAGSETLVLDVATSASVQMADTLDSPPTSSTVLHSLWMHGNIALKAERYFGATPLRSNAVALIDAVASV